MNMSFLWVIGLASVYVATPASDGALTPDRLRCEHLVDPLVIDTRHPRLSWEVRASDPAARGLAQTAYHILVASSPELLAEGKADLWDSGRLTSDQSHLTYKDSTPGRSDYIIIGPYRLYQQYGDKEILRSFYPYMKKWVGYLLPRCTGFLREKEGRWGDWLAMRHNGQPQGADAHLLAQVYFVHVLDLISQIAAELDEDADAQMYAGYEEKARQAFADHFLEADGRIKTQAQTQVTYMLPLALNAVPESMEPAVLDRWMKLFRSGHGVAEVGCISMPYFLPTLSRYGKTSELYEALMHDRIPSWRYMAAHEPTTTVWERWNGVRENGKYFHEPDEDGKRPPGNMSAWNQPHLGNIGGTLFGEVAGIQPAEPGFKRIRIAPAVPRGAGLTWVRATHHTPYGKVISNWKLDGDTLTMEITVPPNTAATVHVPAASAEAVTESGKRLSEAEAVTFVKMENDRAVCELQSGSYMFESQLVK